MKGKVLGHIDGVAVALLLLLCMAFSGLDLLLAQYFQTLNSQLLLIRLYKCLDVLGEPQWYLIPILCVCVFRFRQNYAVSRRLWYIFTMVAVVGVVANFCKWLLGRARPSLYFSEHVVGFAPKWLSYDALYMSFPSGHSAVVFAFAFACGLVFPRYRWWALCFAILIASSRVVLVWHYFSDVIAGALLAHVICHGCYARLCSDRSGQSR